MGFADAIHLNHFVAEALACGDIDFIRFRAGLEVL